MTAINGGHLVVILTLAFGIQTKTSFLEYEKLVIFQYDVFFTVGLVVILTLNVGIQTKTSVFGIRKASHFSI